MFIPIWVMVIAILILICAVWIAYNNGWNNAYVTMVKSLRESILDIVEEETGERPNIKWTKIDGVDDDV